MNKSINFQLIFDEHKIPAKIEWLASNDVPETIELKSLFVAGWEKETKSTATFSIWTKEMRIDEMQQLFIQSLLTMANSFENATGDKKIVEQMKEFVSNLGK